VSFIFPDKIGGLLEKLEEYLKSIPGVNEIEPASTTLI
jgi:translation elongation factor EF-1beta